MAALEPRTLQYMQFHTARLNISDQELEDLRLKLSQHSPMQEALDICLQSLPSSFLPKVVYQLCGQLRGGVGLATRVSAVKSLLRLIEVFNIDFKKSEGRLARIVFEACLSILLELGITSPGLKGSMLGCLSASSLCVSGDYLTDQCILLVNRYSSQFSSNFEDTEALIIAECLGHILRRAGEQLEQDSSAWAPILCFSYIGSFHPDEDVAKAWMVTWNESLTYSGAGNKYSALVKTLPSIVAQICELLHSLSWTQRTIGLSVCRDVTTLLPFEIIQQYLYDIIVALISCVKFRIWNGQAIVLEALVAVLEKYRDVYVYNSLKNVSVIEVPAGTSDTAGNSTVNAADASVADFPAHHQYVKMSNIIMRKDDAQRSPDGGNVEVNCVAIIELLLVESVRGEKAYRYSAAKALSEMNQSWRHLAKYFPEIPLHYIDVFMGQAGIKN